MPNLLAAASLVTCANYPVLDGRLDLPELGTWVATLTLDADVPPTGHVEIAFAREDGDPDIYIGTVLYGYPWQGRSKVTVVGGMGGLTLPELPAQGYSSATLLGMVNDILEATADNDADRETLAAGVEDALSGFSVDKWLRAASGAGRAITNLVNAFGLRWRVVQDGTIWIGTEDWPDETGLLSSPFINDPGDDGVARVITIAPDVATYRPGTVVLGHRINRVVYEITSNTLRAELHYGVGQLSESDRNDAERFVRAMLPELPYMGVYEAMVLAQLPDGTLEVRCDDPAIGELSRVPFRPGIPGSKVVIDPTDRVRIRFASASPSSYFAESLDQYSTSTAPVARKGDAVICGTLTVTGAPGATLIYLPADGGPQQGPLPTIQLSGAVIRSGYERILLPAPTPQSS